MSRDVIMEGPMGKLCRRVARVVCFWEAASGSAIVGLTARVGRDCRASPSRGINHKTFNLGLEIQRDTFIDIPTIHIQYPNQEFSQLPQAGFQLLSTPARPLPSLVPLGNLETHKLLPSPATTRIALPPGASIRETGHTSAQKNIISFAQ